MTGPEIDTTAIRAEWCDEDPATEILHSVCDALDAARAEVADRRLVTTSLGDQMRMWHAKCEKAEAQVAAVRAAVEPWDGTTMGRPFARVVRAALDAGGRTPNLERDGYTVLAGSVSLDAVRAALRCIGLGIRRHGLPGGQGHAECQGGTFLPELRDAPAIWGLLPADTVDTMLGAMFEDEWAEPQILLRFPDETPTCCAHCGYPCPNEGDHPDPCDICDAEFHESQHSRPRPALVPHVDEEPPYPWHEFDPDPRHGYCCGAGPLIGPGWACGMPASDPIHVRRRYWAIVGVALTDCGAPDHGPDDGALYVWPGSHDPWQRTNRAAGQGLPVAVPLKAGDAVVLHPKLAHAGSLNLGHTWQARVYFRLLGASE